MSSVSTAVRTAASGAHCTGLDLAQVLAGSWREETPPLELGPSASEALTEALAPLLIGSGAGGLAWRRLRQSGGTAGQEGSGAASLRQVYVRQALDARLQEAEIAGLLARLRARGIEPLLLKGWSCARLYPELGLRPMGDVDLVVRPEHGSLAASVLGVPVDSDEGEAGFVDLKTGLRPIYSLGLPEVLAHSQRVNLSGHSLLVLGAEHQLRLLCLHFLRHGAWRPLWLCDIAAALESRPPQFDWALCLGQDERRADYVMCALALAHVLLGARIEGTPAQGAQGAQEAHGHAQSLPPWLAPAVLRQWSKPMLSQHEAHPLLASVPRLPADLARAMLLRWPNPIEAVVMLRSPLGIRPLPSQALFYAGICARFLRSRLRATRR